MHDSVGQDTSLCMTTRARIHTVHDSPGQDTTLYMTPRDRIHTVHDSVGQDTSLCITQCTGYLTVHDYPGQDTTLYMTPRARIHTVHDSAGQGTSLCITQCPGFLTVHDLMGLDTSDTVHDSLGDPFTHETRDLRLCLKRARNCYNLSSNINIHGSLTVEDWLIWMKTIYYQNKIRSYLITIVLMAPFALKSTSKLRSTLHFGYSIVIPCFIHRANTAQS